MSCFTSIRNQGGHLKLMNLNKNVHNLLQITKLYTIFEVEEDETAAIKGVPVGALRGSPPPGRRRIVIET